MLIRFLNSESWPQQEIPHFGPSRSGSIPPRKWCRTLVRSTINTDTSGTAWMMPNPDWRCWAWLWNGLQSHSSVKRSWKDRLSKYGSRGRSKRSRRRKPSPLRSANASLQTTKLAHFSLATKYMALSSGNGRWCINNSKIENCEKQSR